jgi:hypothetical protein
MTFKAVSNNFKELSLEPRYPGRVCPKDWFYLARAAG